MPHYITRYRKYYSKYFVQIVAAIMVLSLATQAKAQNSNFSTYPYNPIVLNPAYTGDFAGLWRAAATYRSQTTTAGNAFTTIALGGDAKLPVLKEQLSAGLYILNDNTGAGHINSNKVYASVAYAYTVSENHFRAGLQAGYVSSQIGSWGNWDYASHSFTASNGETGFGETIGYLDFNAGVSWKRNFGLFEPNVALAAGHLNQPNTSFLQGESKEEVNSTLLVRSKIDINENITFEPAFLLSSSAGVSPTILGVNGYYTFTSGASLLKNVNAGIHARNGLTDKLSAITVLAGTRIGTFDIIVAYDLNMGNYNISTGSQGAIEVSLVYRQIPFVLNSYSIPCERY